MTRQKTLWILIALLAVLGLVAFWYWGGRDGSPAASSPASASARPALTVEVTQPVRGSVPLTLGVSGNIAAWQEAVIGSQSNGLRLSELRANVGDTVRKGQVLAVFAAETVQAEVLQARAALLEAEAQAADARSNAERARSIQDTGALSRQQINQFNTAAKASAARVEAARAALRAQQLRQGYTRVLAPDDGVISSRTATVGAVVPAGTELFRMVRQGRLEWRAEVVGQDLAALKVGDSASVDLPDGRQLAGTVRSIAPTLDTARRIAIVYVDLPGAQQQGAKAGMYLSGRFDLGHAEGWMIPHSAVVSRDGFDFIFVLAADSRVQQHKVTLGARQGDLVQVLDGVDGQTRLVHSGAGFLIDGDLVKVVATAAPVAVAPASSASR
ncbi:efflux RND transporter periplasmic adaptor subunit [Brachymonas sp. G13]|uniref:efflux RND transporter periplasmic adaptor subunit n=1 Tax=Brachymonas wangyanguii TaxID=3130163 RepID=UPI00307E97D0